MAITLTADITSTATAVDVTDASYSSRTFPLLTQCGTEFVRILGGTFKSAAAGGTYTLQVERGANGSTAASHSAADTLTPVIPVVQTDQPIPAAPGGARSVAAFTFTETAGDGTYTATVAVPAGALVEDVIFRNTALWTAATSASLVVGDDDDNDGYIAATNLKAAPSADTNGAGAGISTRLSLGATAGAYKGGAGKYCVTAKTITATITKVGAGTAGRSILVVVYTNPTYTAVAKA